MPSFDASLQDSFPLIEKSYLIFRIDVFNLTNSVLFPGPDANPADGAPVRSATGCYTGYGTISQTQQKEGAGKRIRIIDLFHGITAMRRNSLKPVGTDRSLYLSLHRFCCYWTLRTSNFKTGSNCRRPPFAAIDSKWWPETAWSVLHTPFRIPTTGIVLNPRLNTPAELSISHD
jgi:hypothetical protein